MQIIAVLLNLLYYILVAKGYTLPNDSTYDTITKNICLQGGQYHADPYDCHYFIQCSNGTPYRQKCATPLFWNQQLLTCQWSGDHCKDQVATTTKTTPTTEITKPTPTTTEGIDQEICSQGGQYYADPYDCHYFIQCSNGTPYRQKCATPLYWNQKLLTCQWSGDHCKDQVATTTKTTPTTEITKPTPTTTDGIDQEICSQGGQYYADPYDCHYFIQCSNGTPYRQKCATPLYWNQKLLTCQWSGDHCKDQVATTTKTTPTTEITKPTATTTEGIDQEICSQGGQYYADPYDCHYFIQCSNGTPYRQKCATPLYWNQKLLTCQWSGDHCKDQVATTTKTTPTTEITKPTETTTEGIDQEICSQGGQYYADPYDCHYFIQCSNGTPYRQKCATPLYWNQKLLTCQWSGDHCKDQVATTTKTTPTSGVTKPTTATTEGIDKNICLQGGQYHADPYNCHYFIQCSNGRPYRQKCATPLFWNQQLLTCQWSGDHCKDQVVATTQATVTAKPTTANSPTITTTTLSTTTQETTISNKLTSDGSSTSGASTKAPTPSVEQTTGAKTDVSATTELIKPTATTTEGIDKNICLQGGQYHADPFDCHYFIQCSNGRPYRQKCATPLFWNQQLLTCQWSGDHCKDQVATTTKTTPTSGVTKPIATTTEGIDKNICLQGGQYHADPYDCHYFIQCSNGRPYRKKCATPLYWNQQLLTCQWSGDHCKDQVVATTQATVTTKPTSANRPTITTTTSGASTETPTPSVEQTTEAKTDVSTTTLATDSTADTTPSKITATSSDYSSEPSTPLATESTSQAPCSGSSATSDISTTFETTLETSSASSAHGTKEPSSETPTTENEENTASTSSISETSTEVATPLTTEATSSTQPPCAETSPTSEITSTIATSLEPTSIVTTDVTKEPSSETSTIKCEEETSSTLPATPFTTAEPSTEVVSPLTTESTKASQSTNTETSQASETTTETTLEPLSTTPIDVTKESSIETSTMSTTQDEDDTSSTVVSTTNRMTTEISTEDTPSTLSTDSSTTINESTETTAATEPTASYSTTIGTTSVTQQCEEGKAVATKNCEYYSQCIDGEPTIIKCPEGTYWNDQVVACTNDDSSCKEATEGGEQSTTSETVAQTTTDKSTAETANTRTEEATSTTEPMISSETTESAATTEHINYSTTTESEKTSTEEINSTTEVPTSASDATENSTERTTTSEPTTNETIQPTITTEPNMCQGTNTEYHADPNNCTRFIECSNGHAHIRSCPTSYYWNTAQGSCVKGECPKATTPSENPFVTQEITATGSSESTTRTTDESQTTAMLESRFCTNNNTEYYEDRSDCSKFIECYDGRAYQLICPQFHYWDNDNKSCALGDCAQKITSAI